MRAGSRELHPCAAAGRVRSPRPLVGAGSGGEQATTPRPWRGGVRRVGGVWRMVLGAGLACSVHGATGPAVKDEPPIELPPMIVAESSKAPPWLYVQAGDTEYLSRCSAATTRAFITAQQEFNQRLRGLVPEAFWGKTDTPIASILAPMELKRAGDDAVIQEMIRSEAEARRETADKARRALREPISPERFLFLPNLRLDDRDMTAVFTYLDERTFQGDHLVVTSDYVYDVLSRRTPMLPAWLIEGVVSIYQQADFLREPITLEPLVWHSRAETLALLRDPEASRVLLPASELFSPTALMAEANRHERRVAAWRAQVALFFRWAMDPRQGTARDALWKFAARASEQPVTEAWFVTCFGFGFSELRDRLSDYLPLAVKEPVRLDPGKLPRLPRFEVKPATPAQIARLRGEWERLEIPYVRGKYPQFVGRYVEQARFTLRRAYEQGDREPRLLAARGLVELEAGNEAEARDFLEQAAAAGVARPRVHYEVARIRWEELLRAGLPDRALSAEEIRPVVEPLRLAISQAPALPEAFMLLADALLQCTAPPPAADLAAMMESARLFVRLPGIGFRVALLEARQGRKAEAAAVLANALEFVTDPVMRRRYAQLQAALGPATGP